MATSSAVALTENTGEVVDIGTISGEVNFEDDDGVGSLPVQYLDE